MEKNKNICESFFEDAEVNSDSFINVLETLNDDEIKEIILGGNYYFLHKVDIDETFELLENLDDDTSKILTFTLNSEKSVNFSNKTDYKGKLKDYITKPNSEKDFLNQKVIDLSNNKSEYDLPRGYYKKIEIKKENEGKKFSRTYYFMNIPTEIISTTNFYGNFKKISAQKTDNSEIYRSYTKNNYNKVLFCIEQDLSKSQTTPTISDFYIFDENKKNYEAILMGLENQKEELITQGLLTYFNCINNNFKIDKEAESNQRVIEELNIIEDKVRKNEINFKDFLETKYENWEEYFYNELRNLYGRVSEKQNNYNEDAVFYNVLQNQLGLSVEESKITLQEIEKHYSLIKNFLIESELYDVDRNEDKQKFMSNIDFIKLYYKYEELKNNGFLNEYKESIIRERNEYLKYLDESEQYQEMSKIVQNKINFNKTEFEKDILLGNIKFPTEYQYKIQKNFNETRNIYIKQIILDIIKDENSLSFSESKELIELRNYYKDMVSQNVPEAIRDFCIIEKFKDFGNLEKGENILLNENENYINKYVSTKMIPREYKLKEWLKMNHTSKNNPIKKLYENDEFVLSEEYDKDSKKSKIFISTKYKNGSILKEEICSDKSNLSNNIERPVRTIRQFFEEDENFNKKIDENFNQYFQSEIRKNLNIESIERESVNNSIIENMDNIFKENGILFVIRDKQDKDYIYGLKGLYSNRDIKDASSEELCYTSTNILLDKFLQDFPKIQTKQELKDFLQKEDLKIIPEAGKNINLEVIPVIMKKDSIDKIIEGINEYESIKKAKESNGNSEMTWEEQEKLLEVFNKCVQDSYQEVLDKSSLLFDLRKQVLESEEIHKQVKKTQYKTIDNIKMSRKDIEDALLKGEYVSVYDFKSLDSNSLRILKMDDKGIFHEFEITKKNMTSFQKFMSVENTKAQTSLDNTRNIEAIKNNFHISSRTITGKTLNNILEEHTGVNTYVKVVKPIRNDYIKSFWDENVDSVKINSSSVLNLKNIVNDCIGKTSDLQVTNDVEYKFFENAVGQKIYLRFEKLQNEEENESGQKEALYKISYIKDINPGKISTQMTNVALKNGNFEFFENENLKSSLIYPYGLEKYDEDEEKEIISDTLTYLNRTIKANELVINDVKDEFSQISFEEPNYRLDSMFDICQMNPRLLSEIVRNESINESTDIEDLFNYQCKNFEGEGYSNFLIELLKQDVQINRDNSIDSDANSQDIFILNNFIKQAENSDNLQEALSKTIESISSQPLMISDDSGQMTLNTFDSNIKTKTTEEIMDILDLKISQQLKMIKNMECNGKGTICDHLRSFLSQSENENDKDGNYFLTNLSSCFLGDSDFIKTINNPKESREEEYEEESSPININIEEREELVENEVEGKTEDKNESNDTLMTKVQKKFYPSESAINTRMILKTILAKEILEIQDSTGKLEKIKESAQELFDKIEEKGLKKEEIIESINSYRINKSQKLLDLEGIVHISEDNLPSSNIFKKKQEYYGGNKKFAEQKLSLFSEEDKVVLEIQQERDKQSGNWFLTGVKLTDETKLPFSDEQKQRIEECLTTVYEVLEKESPKVDVDIEFSF